LISLSTENTTFLKDFFFFFAKEYNSNKFENDKKIDFQKFFLPKNKSKGGGRKITRNQEKSMRIDKT
jgi:hypothetical protein